MKAPLIILIMLIFGMNTQAQTKSGQKKGPNKFSKTSTEQGKHKTPDKKKRHFWKKKKGKGTGSQDGTTSTD